MFLSEWREFPSAPCLAGGKKKLDSSRLDVAEIARVPDMLPSLFPSWSGSGRISTPAHFLITTNYNYIFLKYGFYDYFICVCGLGLVLL